MDRPSNRVSNIGKTRPSRGLFQAAALLIFRNAELPPRGLVSQSQIRCGTTVTNTAHLDTTGSPLAHHLRPP